MLFLHRHVCMCILIVFIQLYACFLLPCYENCSDDSGHMFILTKRPFKKNISVLPFNKSLYPVVVKGLFYPEQCYTKKASLWCGTEEALFRKIKKQIRCHTLFPFIDEHEVFTQPFLGKLQSYQTADGVQHCRLQDDTYDKERGYVYLLIGNDLYNEPLAEKDKRYLPEQYYTKRSKLWAMKISKIETDG